MHRRGACSSYRTDPGPCPVDDTPHTACTPESVAGLTVAVVRPRVLDLAPVPQPAASPPPVADNPTFTTATYKRAVHGRKRARSRTS